MRWVIDEHVYTTLDRELVGWNVFDGVGVFG